MKKIIASLIACLVIVQTSYAATSALSESLLEYETITTAIGTDPAFGSIIPPTEFIIDIKRLSKDVNNVGMVRYGLLTRILASDSSSGCDCHRTSHHHKYVATLNVTANPGIGPNVITLVSLEQLNDHHN